MVRVPTPSTAHEGRTRTGPVTSDPEKDAPRVQDYKSNLDLVPFVSLRTATGLSMCNRRDPFENPGDRKPYDCA